MKLLLSFFLIAASFIVCISDAQASRIDILPRKVLLEDRQRSAEITLLNMTSKPSVVRIELISYRQKSDGHYEMLKAPLNSAFDPEAVVRISPRQFTLPPSGRQKVRLSVQKPADLPAGEYRFHIRAVGYDPEDFTVRRQKQEGAGISLKMNIGVAIPVVVRHGDVAPTAKLSNVHFLSADEAGLKNTAAALKLDITRTGTAGVMGEIKAYSEDRREIGQLSNVNVFSEVPLRTVTLPLKEVPQGSIYLRYTSDFGNKSVIDELVVQR